MAAKKAAEAVTPEAPEELAAEPEAEKFDLVGADGRRILRSVSRSLAEDEGTRLSALTGEELQVLPAAPLQHTSPDI